ncbi:MAG TPA: hypothetical protein VE842_04975 [Pyrinomonadaceae bacterium]|jgi:ribosomal protein S27AE|nr:hypothetical protein [Pyrinomonadaceae bacterium]
MKKTNKMLCPDCGAQMNHHADKIDCSTDVPEEIDVDLGGALEGVHVCPECGKTALRNPIATNQERPTRFIRRASFAYNGIL